MPGEEFRVAVQEASKVRSPVVKYSCHSETPCPVASAPVCFSCSHVGIHSNRVLPWPHIQPYIKQDLAHLQQVLIGMQPTAKQLELWVVQVEAKVLLGDRRLHITLARVWGSLSPWEKAKLMWMFVHSGLTVSKIKQDIADDIEKLKVCLAAARRLHA